MGFFPIPFSFDCIITNCALFYNNSKGEIPCRVIGIARKHKNSPAGQTAGRADEKGSSEKSADFDAETILQVT